MEVIIDTNVFIDAIFDQLKCEDCWEILHLVRKKEIIPIVCEGLTNEYIFVPSKVAINCLKERFENKTLNAKDFKIFQDTAYECSTSMFKIISENSKWTEIKSNIKVCLHSADDKIVNLAIDSNCKTIITKNIRHFSPVEDKKVKTGDGKLIEIYTPEQFIRNFKVIKWAQKSKADA